MILRAAILLLLTLWSASRAFSQSREVDVLSLILAADSVNVRESAPQTTVGDVLSFLVSVAESDTIASPPTLPPSPTCGIDALNVITDAFSTHDFYASGTWARDEYILYPSAAAPPVTGVLFQLPRKLIVTSPYGYREKFDRMHYGIDIHMCVGDTISLPMIGTVSQVGYDSRGYGHYLIVVHDNGLETRYAHLSKPLVDKGQRVCEGEAIALSGNTGNSTGPHLHLEVRYRGLPLDPRLVFDFSIP